MHFQLYNHYKTYFYIFNLKLSSLILIITSFSSPTNEFIKNFMNIFFSIALFQTHRRFYWHTFDCLLLLHKLLSLVRIRFLIIISYFKSSIVLNEYSMIIYLSYFHLKHTFYCLWLPIVLLFIFNISNLSNDYIDININPWFN